MIIRVGRSRAVLLPPAVLFIIHLFPVTQAGQCVFRQTCINTGIDSPCIPSLTDSTVFENGTFANSSFPMDEAHGFLMPHSDVWNGYMTDATGDCVEGIPDPTTGRCLTPSLDLVPIVCPAYTNDSCCTWEQNYILYKNLHTLVKTFGGPQGCTACAVNLVDMWCALICSPEQSSFARPHNPPSAIRRDDLTSTDEEEVLAPVLQIDVWMMPDYVCALYDSCKSVNAVAQVSGMQSGLGLLTYQGQTGAVGHGEYFFFHFEKDSSDPSLIPLLRPALDCASFFHPGTSDVPFPFPPPQEDIISCSCTYCAAACEGKGLTTVASPISPFSGFDSPLVLGVYLTLFVVAIIAVGYRQYQRRNKGRERGLSASLLGNEVFEHEEEEEDEEEEEEEEEEEGGG